MKQLILIILLLLSGCTTQPRPLPKEMSGRIVILNRNELTPFRGVLLNINDFYILENTDERN